MSDAFDNIKNLGPKKLLIIGVVGVAVLAGLIVLALTTSGGSMSPIYTNLSLEDTQKISSELESQNIPYSIAGNGTTVLVSNDQVLKLRLKFAEMGLPANQGASVGYEIFDKEERLGTSSFTQNMNQLRSLEGELARTIEALQQVKTARVHLVMPKQQLFKKDNYNPTASVQLTMKGGDTIASGEVAAIRYLVSSAVPGLKVEAVTIIDNRGNLLARGGEDGDAGIFASNSSDYKAGYEKQMQGKIVEIIEKFVGMGNIQAQVTADIDFDRIVTNSEIYDPEGQVARSVQSTEETEAANKAAQGGEVSVANNLPGGNANQASSGGQGDRRQRVDEVTNYEISKTIKNHVSETGKVNKLSISVVVDGVYEPNKETGVVEYRDRTPAELKKFEGIIKTAVGFDEKRGDSLSVANMKFSEEFSGHKSDDIMDVIQEDLPQIVQIMVMGLVAILVLLMVIRPLVKRAIEINMAQQGIVPVEMVEPFGLLTGPAAAIQANAKPGQVVQTAQGQMVVNSKGEMAPLGSMTDAEQEGFSILESMQGRQKPSSVKQINEIINRSPEEALTALRNWMYGEVTQ